MRGQDSRVARRIPAHPMNVRRAHQYGRELDGAGNAMVRPPREVLGAVRFEAQAMQAGAHDPSMGGGMDGLSAPDSGAMQ
jgi:hypothetical protein